MGSKVNGINQGGEHVSWEQGRGNSYFSFSMSLGD